MSVWLCIPSKRPPEEANRVLAKWRERGYKIALWSDNTIDGLGKVKDFEMGSDDGDVDYPGYAMAVNTLISVVPCYDPSAEWFVIGGDDVEPDAAHTADEIAEQCGHHFSMLNATREYDGMKRLRTFGVMQPTGDRWGDTPTSRRRYGEDRGAYIDRVCGSAWLGREFCRRINNGRGPLWPEFTHMYVDEALQGVAEKLGILWQRRDLIQLHQHWGRKEGADVKDIPDFLKAVNTPGHWKDSKAIFDRLAARGFAEYAELA